ncbi:MAG TPA: PP2C family serine/threonine-protein phosphatase [Pyrinomonadaceae bacterium]|nr:PP2C family serine/threonine-protein phosphatase [Pyrinomonadaceae bacterium]
MIVELYAKTHVGRVRSGNEDNYLVLDLDTSNSWTGSDGETTPEKVRRFEVGGRGLVLVVSDGMGGALAGDVASQMAVETVRDMLTGGEDGEPVSDSAPLDECLRNAAEYANYAIHRRSQEDPRCSGMGATLTGAAVTPDGLSFVQVGDSRAYVIRGEAIKLATKDQSLVQQLVDVGQISEQEAETHMFRNVILQALGAQPELAPAGAKVRIYRGDIVLLCSDGLSGKLRADDILYIVSDSEGDLERASENLVEEANRRGGEDNITVVLARFSGEDLAAPNTDRITVELPQPPDGDDTITPEEGQTERLV